jgi:hypothetical protein
MNKNIAWGLAALGLIFASPLYFRLFEREAPAVKHIGTAETEAAKIQVFSANTEGRGCLVFMIEKGESAGRTIFSCPPER